ncbi:MAG: ABC transporter permease [Candidatus Accumulibacter sp.]|jgi:lipopolysaccharide transport system permease protein|nr:ABC transporter permease [Accumulibacter sp.]
MAGVPRIASRWADRGFLADLRLVPEQFPLIWKLYHARVAEVRRGSGLGLLAPFISIFVHTALLGFVMSKVFGEPVERFIPFFAVSMSLWQSVSIAISESAVTNERSAQYLAFPHVSSYMIHCVNALDMLMALFSKILAALLIVAVVNPGVLWRANYAGVVLGMLMIVAVMFAWALPIAWMFDRWRILRAFLPQMLFAVYLVTPILWPPDRIQTHRWMIDCNPVFQLIEVGRAPLLDGGWPLTSLAVAAALCALGLLVSANVFRHNRALIVFQWVA